MRALDEIETDNKYMVAFRKGSESGIGPEDKLAYLYLVGQVLGYKRLSAKRLDELTNYLRLATRRRIYMKPSEVGGTYGYCTPRSIDKYFPEYFKTLAIEAIKERNKCPIDDACRYIANYLGFEKINDNERQAISNGIESLITERKLIEMQTCKT